MGIPTNLQFIRQKSGILAPVTGMVNAFCFSEGLSVGVFPPHQPPPLRKKEKTHKLNHLKTP